MRRNMTIAIPAKNDDLDDLFYADALIGRIISFLAAVGVFCAFLALCFFIGYFK